MAADDVSENPSDESLDPSGEISHLGYTADYRWDEAAQRFRGRVARIGGLVPFSGRTLEEARRDFANAVEAYFGRNRQSAASPWKSRAPMATGVRCWIKRSYGALAHQPWAVS